MKIQLGGQQISLPRKEVAAAKKIISHMIETSNMKARAKGAPLFQYTLITVMYVMANDYLNAIGVDALKQLLEAAAATEEKNQEK